MKIQNIEPVHHGQQQNFIGDWADMSLHQCDQIWRSIGLWASF